MRVPHSEGVANHTDPLSSFQIGMPTPYWVRKAIWVDAISRGPIQSRVVRDPGMCRCSLDGNREVSRVTAVHLQVGPRREGEEP